MEKAQGRFQIIRTNKKMPTGQRKSTRMRGGSFSSPDGKTGERQPHEPVVTDARTVITHSAVRVAVHVRLHEHRLCGLPSSRDRRGPLALCIEVSRETAAAGDRGRTREFRSQWRILGCFFGGRPYFLGLYELVEVPHYTPLLKNY